MAIIYVDSNAVGLNDGSSFVNAFTTFNAGSAAFVAGDEVYMADDHSEASAATFDITVGNTTRTTLMRVTRVDSTTELYSPTNGSDTNAFDITGVASDLRFAGHMVWEGIKFRVEDDIQCNISTNNQFHNCHFTLFGPTALFFTDSELAYTKFFNCTFSFTDALGGSFAIDASPVLVGCTFLGNAASAGLFTRNATSRNIDTTLHACDFSSLTHISSSPVIGFSGGSSRKMKFKFTNCGMKLGVPVGSTISNDDQSYSLQASGSGSDNDNNVLVTYRGSVSTDKTTYYLAADAYTDSDTATPLSHVFDPSTNLDVGSELEGDRFYARLDTLGAATLTVQGLENFSTPLTQRDCFILVSYLGNGTTTQHAIDSGKETAKAVYTNLAVGSGVGNWNMPPAVARSVALTVNITNTKIGLYFVQVVLHKYEAGRQLFVNPVVSVT